MKNQKLIIGVTASAVGIIAIIFLARKIKKEMIAAEAPVKAIPSAAPLPEAEYPPGLTTEEKALYRAWERWKTG